MAYEIFIGDAAFGAAVGFLAGILAANLGWNLQGISALAVAVALAGATLAPFEIVIRFSSWTIDKNRSMFVLAALCLAAFFCGAFYYRVDAARIAAETELPTGKAPTFSAVITAEPDVTAKYILLAADLEKPYAGAITIFAPLDLSGSSFDGGGFRYGDEVQITSAIEPPQTSGDTPATFPRTIKFIAAHRGFWLREDLLDFKAAVLEKFGEALPNGDEAALLGGETLGGTDGMSASLKSEMSASGTSYITAMYGYKIFVIAAFVEAALANWVARRVRFAASVAAVLLFVVMAGGGASVIRGAIMGLLALIAKNTGRVFNMRNALAFTALAMALWDPTIFTQAVFLLSFLSVIGIAYLARPLEKLFGWDGGASQGNGARIHGAGIADTADSILGWREAIVVATASLLPIVPIIAVAFGDFSLSAFPSNALIALPLSAITLLGFALALAGFTSSWLAFLVAKFVSVILLYQLAVIKIFAAIVVPSPAIFSSPIIIAGYYLVLAVWIFLEPRRIERGVSHKN